MFYYFRAATVRRFATKPWHRWTNPPDYLYVGIDPSGGGKQSDYAMATLGYCAGTVVLVSMDHVPSADSRLVEEEIYTHIKRLRQHPRYRNSVIRVYVEANLSYLEADRVYRVLNRPELAPVEFESRDTSKQVCELLETTSYILSNLYVYVYVLGAYWSVNR